MNTCMVYGDSDDLVEWDDIHEAHDRVSENNPWSEADQGGEYDLEGGGYATFVLRDGAAAAEITMCYGDEGHWKATVKPVEQHPVIRHRFLDAAAEDVPCDYSDCVEFTGTGAHFSVVRTA